MKLLHLICDETYAKSALSLFNSAGLELNKETVQDFVCLRPSDICHHTPSGPTRSIPINQWKLLASEADIVIVHNLTKHEMKAVQVMEPGPVIVWNGLGGDYYDLIRPWPLSLLTLQTALLWIRVKVMSSQASGLRASLRIRLENIVRLLQTNVLSANRKQQLAKNFDFFSPVLFEEFDLLAKKLPSTRYLDWNYSPDSELFSPNEGLIEVPAAKEPSVLIGHSAAWENNHLDSLRFFQQVFPKNYSAVAALACGDSQLVNAVESIGDRLLGDRFSVITEMVSNRDFALFVGSFSYLLLSSKRQIGAGTAILAFLQKTQLVLKRENPLFSYFVRVGFRVHGFHEFTKGSPLPHLSESDLNHNRNLAITLFRKDSESARTVEALKVLIVEHSLRTKSERLGGIAGED